MLRHMLLPEEAARFRQQGCQPTQSVESVSDCTHELKSVDHTADSAALPTLVVGPNSSCSTLSSTVPVLAAAMPPGS